MVVDIKNRKIYLDNAATTKVDDEVVKAMLPYFNEKYGNASSIHSFGSQANNIINKVREKILKKLNLDSARIIFTSGGTESNNLAIKGVAFSYNNKGNHIITQKTEHPSVLNVCKYLEKNGFKISYLDVDEDGFINLEELKKTITKDTILVTIMHANNEIGTVQPINDIYNICKEHKIIFHTDACQSFCKIKDIKADLITINAHKIHGPKGVGALVVKEGIKLSIQQHGGGQENGLRSGTLNTAGIVGLGRAIDVINEQDIQNIKQLRDYFIKKILNEIPETKLNGPKQTNKRLCNNINISFKAVEGEALMLRLDLRNITVSTGSACSSKSLKPSHVLTAIGLKPELAHSSLRISLSKYNTKQEIDHVVNVIKDEVDKLRKLSPFWKNV